jgi:hypothetical protein
MARGCARKDENWMADGHKFLLSPEKLAEILVQINKDVKF